MSDQRELGCFFSGLQRALVDGQSAERKDLAERFSPIGLMLRSRTGEIQLSAIIAFLLDPTAAHGQGSAFMQSFQEIIGIQKSPNSTGVMVTPEYTISNGRRIDIFIEFPIAHFAVAIENKPWASDDNHQVSDYCCYLERRYPQNWLFVYLSGRGSDPPQHSISADAWLSFVNGGSARRMSYSTEHGQLSVERWLEICVLRCQAEAPLVKQFLLDVLGYVKRFGNDRSDIMALSQLELEKFILSDARWLDLAKRVPEVVAQIPRKLIVNFLGVVAASLRETLQPPDWIVKHIVDPNDTDLMKAEGDTVFGLLAVRNSAWPTTTNVAFGSKDGNCKQIYVGIYTAPQAGELTASQWKSLQDTLFSPELKREELTFEEQSGGGWWPVRARMHDYVDFDDFSGGRFEEFARKLLRNELAVDNEATKLSSWLVKFAGRADAVIRGYT